VAERPDTMPAATATAPERTRARARGATARRAVVQRPPAAAASAGTRVGTPADQVRALANQGRLPDAERVCAAALEQRRDDAELLYLQSVLLSESGQLAAAVRAARQALYLEPRLIVAHLALGSALARLHDWSGARRAFTNAERLLAGIKADELVHAAGGESAGRLLEVARMQLRLTPAVTE
jgi:chemotaxis protein methyltransferase CheR